jgi:sulfur-carrier protein adenylyltransferase/sulfurtransferase
MNTRYSRHLRIPEVGEHGQQLLAESRVLVVGSGGLGSPALMYLAAAGVGCVGIVDHDLVDLSNLQRQVIFDEVSVGTSKTHVAAQRIRDLNSTIEVLAYDTLLTSDNALDILSDFDVVIDATDNFATRYLINDSCVLLGIPYVWGSILRFDGQISVFGHVNGPCYRCVFPEPPQPGTVPSCADAGVLGAICGVIGSMQATTALTLIMGMSTALAGSIGVFNARDMSFDKVPVQRNPECAVCGDSPTVTELIDYPMWCSASDLSLPRRELQQLLLEREAGQTDFVLVDIREPSETSLGMIPGAIHVPLSELETVDQLGDYIRQLCGDSDIIFYCASGYRSERVIRALTDEGMHNVRHYPGGFSEWNATQVGQD